VATDVLSQLWQAAPAGVFKSLTGEAARWAAELPVTWAAAGGPFEQALLDEAVEFLATAPPTVEDDALLHQDLHGGNILSSERGWLAIDPKPLVGERAFDVASLLRDRRDEIPALLHHCLEREAVAIGLDARPALTDELLACLLAAPWPGNVRELENLCKHLVRYGDLGRPLDLADLPPDFVAPLGTILRRRHDESSLTRRAHEALERAQGNKAAAARLLGISRTHLYRLLTPADETRSAV